MQTIEEIRAAYASSAGRDIRVSGRFAVASTSMRDGKNGQFMTLELRDPTGSLVARCFDQATIGVIAGAGAIDAQLRVNEFNGSMSSIVNGAQQATLTAEEVLWYAGLDVDAHASRVAQLSAWLDACDGTIYGQILRDIFREPGTWEAFTMAAAAVRMHHAEPGGLVRHLVEVGSSGLALLDSTGQPYDQALFLAGVFLHDIGKLDTYTPPPTIAYSAHGQLAEHQIFSTFRLGKACARLDVPPAIEAQLIHMIEQAHGAYRHAEWQDPVGLEAKTLATADYYSSRLGVTDKEVRAQEALDALFAAGAEVAAIQ
jgi:3'-5' exoribonuclease